MKLRISSFALIKSVFGLLATLALSFSFPYRLNAQSPAAPTNLVATANSTTKVSLTWSPAVAGGKPIANYRVYSGSSVASLAQVAITTKTSYTDTSVSEETTYYYAVQAADTGGNLSPMSAPAKVTTPMSPSAPANFVATPLSIAKVSLSWSAAASGGLPIANYRVYKGSSPSNMTQLVITSKTSYTDTSVSAGATYYYGVQAADTGGDLSPVPPGLPVTVFTPPSAPTGVAPTPTSTTKLTVTWNASATGGLPILNYRVFRGSSASNLAQLATMPSTSYTDRTVNPGATYYYAVQAADTAQDLSMMSAVANVTVFTPPAAPTGVGATPLSSTKVSLAWSPAASGGLPVQYYQVFRGSSPSNLSKMATVTQTSYTDNSLTVGTTYYYGVEAQDSAMDLSKMSAVVPSTGFTPPYAPTNVVPTPASATKVSLTWSPAASGGLPVQYYQVFRGSSPSNLVMVATVAQTSYTDTTVCAKSTYYYGVEAEDSGLDLSPISVVAPVTLPAPPSAPASVVPTPAAATKVSLTWSQAASGGLPVSFYEVFRGNAPSNLSQVATVAQNSYMDTSLTAGLQYYYAVVAEDAGGDLSPMSPVAPVTVPTPPSAPTGVVATPMSATTASLTWSAAASGGLPIQFYQVSRGSSPSNLAQVATTLQTAFTDTSLNPGAKYYYAVQAVDSGADVSPLSAVVNLTEYMNPSVPAGLAAIPASSVPPGAAQTTYNVALTWSAPTSTGLQVNFYQVFRGSSPSTLSQVATTMQTSYTDNNLTPTTTYYYAIVAADTAGDLSAMSPAVAATTGGGQTSGLFNLLPMSINNFSPSPATLPGLPMVQTASGLAPAVAYQDGAFLNGKAVYFPWEIADGGGSWITVIQDGIPQSVALSYNASNGVAGFSDPGNWTYFDLSTLSWYSKGGNQGTNPLPNLPAGFQGGTVAGNMVYPAPIGTQGSGSGGGPYPVFIQYNSLKTFNDPTAYQTFVPPPMYTTMGNTYGWCTAVFDGRFVYYAPLANSVTGYSGNIFRYDTTQPFSNLDTGGVTPAWANFDIKTGPNNPGGIDPNAEGFQAVAYDGHRYIYFIPFQATLIVRYDTWNGGTGPDPTGFTVASNYVTFDPTHLGTPGYPAVAGQGNTANLAGFTGQQVIWDAANQNEYLYLVPWATYPNSALNPTLQSTAARVRIGMMAGSTWIPIDITSTATSPAGSTPQWEMYDLTLLTQNPAWPSDWPLLQSNPEFSMQSAIAGWQEAYTITSNSSGVTFPPRVGFVADTSQFLVQHDVGHHLYEPTGWYVSLLPSSYNFGTMGGGYDPTNAILYPSSPAAPLYVFQFQ